MPPRFRQMPPRFRQMPPRSRGGSVTITLRTRRDRIQRPSPWAGYQPPRSEAATKRAMPRAGEIRPGVAAGSVLAAVNRCLGLARGAVYTTRIPRVRRKARRPWAVGYNRFAVKNWAVRAI